MDALIVGAGEMGRWFGRVLLEELNGVELAFVDDDPATAAKATDAVGGYAVRDRSSVEFDLVCIAVPIPATREAIATHAPSAGEAILDVTGTMRTPIEAMAEHAPECERMSLHPLFAPANEPGNVPAVVDESGPLVEGVRDAIEARDNTVVETTPAEHDELMETVQARTHTAILAFALAAGDVPDHFQTDVSEQLFDLAEQVTNGNSRVYGDIQATFEGATDVAEAAKRIAETDHEQFANLYDEAQK